MQTDHVSHNATEDFHYSKMPLHWNLCICLVKQVPYEKVSPFRDSPDHITKQWNPSTPELICYKSVPL